MQYLKIIKIIIELKRKDALLAQNIRRRQRSVTSLEVHDTPSSRLCQKLKRNVFNLAALHIAQLPNSTSQRCSHRGRTEPRWQAL